MASGTDGKLIVVQYDRVNGVQKVWSTINVVECPDETIFAFEWRRYKESYDPSSDGIGVESTYKTVKGTALVDASWRVVPYNSGKSGSTQLLFGITAATTTIPVVSMFPLPTAYPYIVTVGGDEKMLVTAGNLTNSTLTVVRGYDGTIASIHERGETVEYKADEVPEEEAVEVEQPPPQEIPWPAGEAYARLLLEKLHRPKRLHTVRLANVHGDWSSIQIGSVHSIDIQTEGPGGGITGTVRVLGFAPDPAAGSMELVLEDVW
jgi:hypothetical protein